MDVRMAGHGLATEQASEEVLADAVRCRVHESLGNVTTANAHFGQAAAILTERRRIKENTIHRRRLINVIQAA